MYSANKKLKKLILISISIFLLIVLSLSCNLNSIKQSWNTNFMNYSDMHKYSTGKNQTIALIDSGVSRYYSDTIYEEISVIGNDLQDINGHGTIVYSIIKGYTNLIKGISPDSNIISIKILDKDEKITPSSIKKAIEIAIENKVNIINLSIGSYKYNKDVEDIINKAIKNNIIVVASAGDYYDTKMMFPANLEGVISVGAIDENRKILELTSGSNDTTINAPGKDINGLSLDNKIISSTGTSQATALISGYISLILSYSEEKNISLNLNEIKEYLNLINKKEASYSDIFKIIDTKESD